MIVTLPLGYNSYVDRLLEENKINFTERYCLKRISKDNKWKEVTYEEVKGAKYGSPFPFANAIVILVFKKTTENDCWRT
jgi:hypothetical protein